MKKQNGKKKIVAWAVTTGAIAVLLSVATPLATTTFRPILKTVLGGKKPIMADGVEEIYTSDYKTKKESKAAGDKLNVAIAEEGFTLLLNENEALPLNKEERKVSVFGKNSTNLVLGGSGSGGGVSGKPKSIFDGLEAAGIKYNETLKSFYESDKSGDARSDSPALTEGSTGSPTLKIGEAPVSKYTADVMNSFNEYNDAAIVVISRLGGESWDLPREQDTANGGIEGNHYLQLDQNEYDMLDLATSRFKKVIVVLNTLTSFQCDFIKEYNNSKDKRIDSVVWIGGPGATGAEAIGKLLTGEKNFSGRSVDLYSKDFTKDPTWQNFSDNSQVEGGGNCFKEGESDTQQYYVSYEEGVYTGYRYYETRSYEESKTDYNINWYDENVVFPFGHGLSYTKFNQTMTQTGSLVDGSSKLHFEVEVENVGNYAGKDTVELYVTLPYYKGGIEKSRVQLVDFAKTKELKPGETQKVSFDVDAYDLASYDYNDANSNQFKGYELEHGTYTFYASKNSHVDGKGNVYQQVSVDLANDVKFENDTTTNTKVENRYTFDYSEDEINFNDLQYRLSDVVIENTLGNDEKRKGMSRTNFKETFPKADTAEERIYKAGEKEAILNKDTNNLDIASVTTMPKTDDQSSQVTLRDLIGKDYNDPLWDELLNRLTKQEMLDLINNGAFQTNEIPKIKKNLTNDSDGPIGFVNFMPGLSSHYKDTTTFCCEILIAATWNKDLAYQMGKIVGDNGVWGDNGGNDLPYTGWYAPAVNLHRSPFAGRNFEYYSEDPILSGRLAVNVINGAATKGVYTDLKHFALNDQETARTGVNTFCTEQALREIYLKPFEIAVKGKSNIAHSETAVEDKVTKFVGTHGVMSSFNRIGTRWTGGDYRLMTNILRDEWGFRGLVISDYKTDNSVMNSRQMVYAGNDLILASLKDLLWNDCDFDNAQDVTVLRNCSHNILYTVANSNSMNVDIVGYSTEWWVKTLIAIDITAAVALGAWGALVILNYNKKKNELEITEVKESN